MLPPQAEAYFHSLLSRASADLSLRLAAQQKAFKQGEFARGQGPNGEGFATRLSELYRESLAAMSLAIVEALKTAHSSFDTPLAPGVDAQLMDWGARALSNAYQSLEGAYQRHMLSFGFELSLVPGLARAYALAQATVANLLSSYLWELRHVPALRPRRSLMEGTSAGQPVTGVDAESTPTTGYAGVDDKITVLRGILRRHGRVDPHELSSVLELLSVLGNLAGRAVQDAEFDGIWSEDRFQDYVRKELRRASRIGSGLEEHAVAAGGIMDLSFRGITIELKVVDHRIRNVEDCRRYVEQTASYAAANGKRVALLCVLDCSKKVTAPGLAADGL